MSWKAAVLLHSQHIFYINCLCLSSDLLYDLHQPYHFYMCYGGNRTELRCLILSLTKLPVIQIYR